MTKLEQKTTYIIDLTRAKRFLPFKYMAELQTMLPGKTMSRIKNACSALVRDEEVLKAVEKIAERERKRRYAAARKEMRATEAI